MRIDYQMRLQAKIFCTILLAGTDSALAKVDDLHKSFMDEPAGERNHRYIIMVPQHKSVGVGIAIKSDELYLVEEFAGSE